MRFTRQELLDRTGITYSQFKRWQRRGIVPPAVVPNGQKNAAYYTDDHLARIQVIVATLIDGRVTIDDLRERFEYEANPELLDDGDVFDL